MFDNADDFKKKALDNKDELKREYVKIPIGDGEQDFKISGIGEKAIKIEKYIKYDDMVEAVESGNEDGLEAFLMKFVEEY